MTEKIKAKTLTCVENKLLKGSKSDVMPVMTTSKRLTMRYMKRKRYLEEGQRRGRTGRILENTYNSDFMLLN